VENFSETQNDSSVVNENAAPAADTVTAEAPTAPARKRAPRRATTATAAAKAEKAAAEIERKIKLS